MRWAESSMICSYHHDDILCCLMSKVRESGDLRLKPLKPRAKINLSCLEFIFKIFFHSNLKPTYIEFCFVYCEARNKVNFFLSGYLFVSTQFFGRNIFPYWFNLATLSKIIVCRYIPGTSVLFLSLYVTFFQ
jgi:hypothetical protein